MSKATVTKLFISGGLAIIAGGMLAIAAIWFAIASNVFVMNGADVVAVRGSALAWSLLGVALVGGLAIMAGAIAGLASWIGALLNTVQLDKRPSHDEKMVGRGRWYSRLGSSLSTRSGATHEHRNGPRYPGS